MSEAAIKDALDVIAKRIGRDVPCPICGHDDWQSLGGMYVILPPGVFLPTGEQAMSHALLGLACGNCRFVRLHDAHPSDA